MEIRAHTAWGCPCTVKLDGKGRYESAVDYFGAPLQRTSQSPRYGIGRRRDT